MRPTLPDLERLARQAGDILHRGYDKEHEVIYKGAIDLVTEVDHQSEAFLLGEIQKLFTGHQIVSEEAGLLPGSSADQWYIDPLDGTVNYAHGIPIFSVSMAYAHAGAITLAAVYDPMRDEMFLAERGQGSWVNGCKLQVSNPPDLQHCLLVTGFPYDSWNTVKNNLDNFARFMRLTQGVRRLGSAALDLCYVAAGRLDGYWELSLKPWDIAAGALIAAEAGAKVTNLQGGEDIITPPCSSIVASPEIHSKMFEVLNNHQL